MVCVSGSGAYLRKGRRRGTIYGARAAEERRPRACSVALRTSAGAVGLRREQSAAACG